ncbi:MAG: hypothetical protein OK439_01705 [Thaumarchaeota archaeon]|nr:hypothetical protein [Nitrososphaerota archaeon]
MSRYRITLESDTPDRTLYIFTAELDVSPASARNLGKFVGAVKEKLMDTRKEVFPTGKIVSIEALN